MENIPLCTAQSRKNAKFAVKHDIHLTENIFPQCGTRCTYRLYMFCFTNIESPVFTTQPAAVNPQLSGPRNGTPYSRRGPLKGIKLNNCVAHSAFSSKYRWQRISPDTGYHTPGRVRLVHTHETHFSNMNTNIILWETYQTASILADNLRRHLLRYHFWNVTLRNWACFPDVSTPHPSRNVGRTYYSRRTFWIEHTSVIT
jgi:hypothetical protein